MKKLFYIGALSALLLVGCGEAEKPIPENKTLEYPTPSDDEEPVSAEVNKELNYYEAETKVFVDEYVNKFDNTWNNIWVLTMKRAEAKEITTQDAYSNLKKVKEAYKALSVDSKIPTKELSKPNKKLAEKIVENLNMAAANRQSAAEIAMEILETNSTAKLNDMNEKVEWSNNFMSEAMKAKEELESNLK